MAKIDFLQDSSNEYIYPITVVEAIYTLKGDTLIDVLNSHVDAIDEINENIRYSTTRPVPVTIGGIQAGQRFAGAKLVDVVDELLHPMTSPSITITPNIMPGTYPITACGDSEAGGLGVIIDSILPGLGVPLFNIESLDIELVSGLYCIESVSATISAENSGLLAAKWVVLSEQLPPMTEPQGGNLYSKTITFDDGFSFINADKITISVTAVDTFGASHQKDVYFHLVPPILIIKQYIQEGITMNNVSGYVCVPCGENKAEIEFNEFNSEGIALLVPAYLGRISKIIDRGGFDIRPIFKQVTLDTDTDPIGIYYNLYTTTPILGDIADNINYINLLNYSCTIYFEN